MQKAAVSVDELILDRAVEGRVIYLLLLITMVQPISWWARSYANLEMVVGVLYITIIV